MPKKNKPNITIIVLDTLRLDIFNELIKIRGMELSRLGNFVLLDNCIAPSSWTLPSHASIFTGMYPSEHGAHETKDVKSLDIKRIALKDHTFLADLKAMKYKSYAISANPYVHPIYGFNEFDYFKREPYFVEIFGSVVEVSDRLKPMFAKYREKYGADLFSSLVKIPLAVLAEDPGLFLEGVASGIVLTPISAARKIKAKLIDGWPLEKGGRRTVKAVREMTLRKPFFLFLNLMEPHDPYTDSKKWTMNWATPFLKTPVRDDVLRSWQRLYKKASQRGYAYVYSIIKNLIERFGDDQIIILTSDHGQEFNEHGFIGHGTVLHDEVVKVPMAVLLPKQFASAQNRGYSSLVNIRRFILAALSGEKNAADLLFSKEVRAESFGIPAHISISKGIDVGKLRKYERVIIRKFASD